MVVGMSTAAGDERMGAIHEGSDESWILIYGRSHIHGALGLSPKSLFSRVWPGCFPRRLNNFTGRSRLRVLFWLFFSPKTVNWRLFYSFVRFKGLLEML